MAITEYTDIAGCTLLLKQTTGVYSDSGVTPAVEGSLIAQWSDQSGGGNHATQATGTAKPTYSLLTNGRVSFDYWRTANDTTPRIMALPIGVNRRAFTMALTVNLNTTDRTQYLVYNGGFDLVVYLEDGVLKVYSSGFYASTLMPPTGQAVTIVIVGDAAGSRFFMNTLASKQTLAAFQTGSTAALSLGTGGASTPACNFYEIAWWDSALSDGNVTDVLALAVSRNGTKTTPTNNLVIDGDSITEGYGATLNRNWSQRLTTLPAGNWVYNNSASGATLDAASADAATTIDLYSFKATGYLAVPLGTNNIIAGESSATIQGKLATYCNDRIAAGWTKANIILFTLAGSSNSSVRDTYNTWLRANYATYGGTLIDVAADANIGSGSGYGATYWLSENPHAHYTDAGYQALADLFATGVPSLFASTGSGLIGGGYGSGPGYL